MASPSRHLTAGRQPPGSRPPQHEQPARKHGTTSTPRPSTTGRSGIVATRCWPPTFRALRARLPRSVRSAQRPSGDSRWSAAATRGLAGVAGLAAIRECGCCGDAAAVQSRPWAGTGWQRDPPRTAEIARPGNGTNRLYPPCFFEVARERPSSSGETHHPRVGGSNPPGPLLCGRRRAAADDPRRYGCARRALDQ